MDISAETPLRDAVCIVTGGGSGIGRALCLLLGSAGAKVVVVGRTPAKVDAVAAEVQAAGGVARSYAVDVADEVAVRALAEEVLRAFARIDVLVNNAGHSASHRRLQSSTPDEIRGIFGSNVIGAMFCTQAVVPSMRAAGHGTIVNVASIAALEPGVLPGMAYGAAKAAVANFTRFLGQDLRNTGIRTCVVFPGEVDTPILEKRPVPPDPDARATMMTPEDIAQAIALVLRMPARTTISELVLRPTRLRDAEPELERN
jgi:NAD(P)-dependent dehydrogenase (short-subunit alcohol dehydrogenase family)